MRATYSPSTCGMHHMSLRLEVVFGQTPAHRLARDAVVLGEPDQFVRQQLQGPTGAALGWARTGGRDQQGFLFARELAARSRTRLFTERGLQVADDKAALGPVHGRAAHADAGRDLLVTGARVGSQQNLRALELARRMFAPAQKRRECAALGLAEFDPITYIHLCLLVVRGTDQQLNRMAGVSRPAKTFTPKQGHIWRLSTHTRVCTAGLRPKP